MSKHKKNEYGIWEVPVDYEICYDNHLNYNEENNDNYLPPYRSDFPSIYEGIEVEMHIVDHCNLNCNCCNHFSPIAKPWYISLEDFQSQLKVLKNNISTVKSFIILGGEPALHPQLLELCISAREILGSQTLITVLSNGTLIKDIKKNKEAYLRNDIKFTFSSYFNKTKIEEIQELKPLGRVFNTRILSKQTLVEPSGSLNGHFNFFNCANHKLPCFTLKDYKLFICPFAAHINIYNENLGENIPLIKNDDYLDIREINNDLNLLQKFCFSPKNICKYCSQNTIAVPYGPSYKDNVEFEIPIFKLYFQDYRRYENIINQGKNKLIHWATDPNQNPGRVDTVFHTHIFETELLRHKTGKIDIIIPYYNETVDQFKQLRDNLLKQSIIKDCVLYFISDNGNMDARVIQIFSQQNKLHCVFLKNVEHEGPGATRNIGIINSYNKYLLFLDADNLFIDEKALENIYNKINNKYSLVEWSAYSSENKSQINYCVNRDVLNNNNLLFKNIFFGEDNEFYIRLGSLINQNEIYSYNNLKNIFIQYNATSKNNNITTNFFLYDKLHFSYLTSNFIGIFEMFNSNKIINEEFLNNQIHQTLKKIIAILDKEHLWMTENTFLRSLMYVSLYYLQLRYPDVVNMTDYITILKLYNIDIFDNNFEMIKNYCLNYIIDNYQNNYKLQINANYYINLLKGAL